MASQSYGSPDAPSVLLISTDHWPAYLMGGAGHPAIRTPTLDSLAGAGVRYTNAYAECPVCIPARRTLMTGATTRTHGDRVFKVQEPMPQLPTVAQTFRDAGYQAYAVGKLHIFPQRDRIGFDDVILAEEGPPHPRRHRRLRALAGGRGPSRPLLRPRHEQQRVQLPPLAPLGRNPCH